MDTVKENLARLRWSCRRGMLELDVLLINFLNEAYLSLTAAEQNAFKEVLSLSDQTLYEWLTGNVSAENSPYFPMINKIRAHAIARHQH